MPRFSVLCGALALVGQLIPAILAHPSDITKRDSDKKGKCGKTIRKTLDITWEVGSPNGNARPMTFVNGQFPAPNLVFDEDDDVYVSTVS